MTTKRINPIRPADEVRAILRKHPEGLGLTQICELYGRSSVDNIRAMVKGMPDVYIARWEKAKRGPTYAAIFCAAHVPEDAPAPPIIKMARNNKAKVKTPMKMYNLTVIRGPWYATQE